MVPFSSLLHIPQYQDKCKGNRNRYPWRCVHNKYICARRAVIFILWHNIATESLYTVIYFRLLDWFSPCFTWSAQFSPWEATEVYKQDVQSSHIFRKFFDVILLSFIFLYIFSMLPNALIYLKLITRLIMMKCWFELFRE